MAAGKPVQAFARHIGVTSIAAGATALLLIAACSGAPADSTTTVVAADLDAAATRTAAVTPGMLVLEVQGISWNLPASACLRAAGDAEATGRAATEAAEVVRGLVADRVSGWPTTTRPPDRDAGFFVEVNRWGPIALALGTVAGTRTEVVASWSAFEQRYADPAGGWGPVTDITTRLAGWGATADLLVAALAERC